MPSAKQSSAFSAGRTTEDRIDQVEIELTTIAAEQRALTDSVASVTKSVHDLSRSVQAAFERSESRADSLRALIQEQNKPKWSMMAGMFGVLVVIVGWYAKSEIAPLDSRVGAFERLVESVVDDRERLARLEERARLTDEGLLITPGERDFIRAALPTRSTQ